MHPLTIWLALAGSIWALFAFAEDHMTPAARTAITAWLRRQTPDWAGTLSAVWDSVFASTPRTGTSFIRSCVMSHVTAFLWLCVSGVLYPGTMGSIVLGIVLYAPLLLTLLSLASMVSGHLSLRLHRLVLHYVRCQPEGYRLLRWLGLSSLVTCGMALLAWGLSVLVVHLCSKLHLLRYPVTWISGYIEFILKGGDGSLSALQEALQLRPIQVPGIVFPSLGIWLYTPCFPLIWGWLYVLSGTLLRQAVACGLVRLEQRSSHAWNLDVRPLHALGAVAVGLVSLLYWLAMYLR